MKYNFCPNCGFKLEENFNYCPNCGLELESQGKVHQPEPARTPVERDYGSYAPRTTEVPSTIEKAKGLFRDRDYAGALSYLIEYADTNDVEILYMIGQCLYMTKKFDPSCERFLRLAADKGHPLAQASLGELYYSLAEECGVHDYDPYSGMSRERYEEARSKCEMYYTLALEYLNKAKNNGVR